MRRILLALILGVLIIVLAGCDEKTTYAYAELLGEWDFPTEANSPHVSVMQVGSEEWLDISWDVGDSRYLYMIEGEYENGIFIGTYDFNLTVIEETWAIQISLQKPSGKLTIQAEGEGPLDGIVFNNGVISL